MPGTMTVRPPYDRIDLLFGSIQHYILAKLHVLARVVHNLNLVHIYTIRTFNLCKSFVLDKLRKVPADKVD